MVHVVVLAVGVLLGVDLLYFCVWALDYTEVR